MTEQPSRDPAQEQTSARDRVVATEPVEVLRPGGEVHSPIYDDSEQVAAMPDVLEQ